MLPTHTQPEICEGAWQGSPAFLVAGGPSLKDFNWNLLSGRLTIAINRSFERVENPSCVFTIDERYLQWVLQGTLGTGVRDRFLNLDCPKVLVDCTRHLSANTYRAQGVDILPINKFEQLSKSLAEGISTGGNSGYAAINLAIILGANPIYLLGYDMGAENPKSEKQDWWHNGYPIRQPIKVYDKFKAEFAKGAELMRDKASIINLNLKSNLHEFEFDTVESVIAQDTRPVWVAYYTRGTGYEQEAERLRASLIKLGLPHEIWAVDNLGSWQANTQYKATFISDMMFRHWGRSIVYTDVDSVVARQPDLFNHAPLNTSLMVHYHKDKELLSGTFYLRCDATSAELVNLWQDCCKANPGMWDQKCLQEVVEGGMWDGIVTKIPADYCCIFDAHPEIKNPAVVHYQASRRLKKEVGA